MKNIINHLALWFFMKLGPCLRNSVVSPKTGQPIVPGGKPFFLYLTSFHLNKEVLNRQIPKATPNRIIKTAIDLVLPRSSTNLKGYLL